MTSVDSSRTMMPHAATKTSSTKRSNPEDKLKKRNQISKDLSDLVVYVQVRIYLNFKHYKYIHLYL